MNTLVMDKINDAVAPKYNVAYHQETKEIQHHLVHQLGKNLYRHFFHSYI